MWKYVNSKGICVMNLLISPVLRLNRRSDLIVKDCQHKLSLKEIRGVRENYLCTSSSFLHQKKIQNLFRN
jgi:hypothetical protein